MSILAGLGRALPTIIQGIGAIQAMRRPSTTQAMPGTGFSTGGGFGGGFPSTMPLRRVNGGGVGMRLDPTTGLLVKKRRALNPCNSKALLRAARRLRAYAKMNKRVERALRKAIPSTMRRSKGAPSRSKRC